MADLCKDMFDSLRFLKSTVEGSWSVLVYRAVASQKFLGGRGREQSGTGVTEPLFTF